MNFAIYCHLYIYSTPTFSFWGIVYCIKRFSSVLERCPSYREYIENREVLGKCESVKVWRSIIVWPNVWQWIGRFCHGLVPRSLDHFQIWNPPGPLLQGRPFCIASARWKNYNLQEILVILWPFSRLFGNIRSEIPPFTIFITISGSKRICEQEAVIRWRKIWKTVYLSGFTKGYRYGHERWRIRLSF